MLTSVLALLASTRVPHGRDYKNSTMPQPYGEAIATNLHNASRNESFYEDFNATVTNGTVPTSSGPMRQRSEAHDALRTGTERLHKWAPQYAEPRSEQHPYATSDAAVTAAPGPTSQPSVAHYLDQALERTSSRLSSMLTHKQQLEGTEHQPSIPAGFLGGDADQVLQEDGQPQNVPQDQPHEAAQPTTQGAPEAQVSKHGDPQYAPPRSEQHPYATTEAKDGDPPAVLLQLSQEARKKQQQHHRARHQKRTRTHKHVRKEDVDETADEEPPQPRLAWSARPGSEQSEDMQDSETADQLEEDDDEEEDDDDSFDDNEFGEEEEGDARHVVDEEGEEADDKELDQSLEYYTALDGENTSTYEGRTEMMSKPKTHKRKHKHARGRVVAAAVRVADEGATVADVQAAVREELRASPLAAATVADVRAAVREELQKEVEKERAQHHNKAMREFLLLAA